MGAKQTLSTFGKRITNHLPWVSKATASLLVRGAIYDDRSRRSPIMQQEQMDIDKIIEQPWPYKLLKSFANNHPYLRIVHGAIIRQAVKNRWENKPKFEKKCLKCGREYQDKVDHCEDCEPGYTDYLKEIEERQKQEQKTENALRLGIGVEPKPQNQFFKAGPEAALALEAEAVNPGVKYFGPALLRDPNPVEKQRADAFLEDPNRDDEMLDIIVSLLKDHLAVDDWYLSVAEYQTRLEGIVFSNFAIYNEDASEIFIAATKRARLGNGQWFCPKCFDYEKHSETYTIEQVLHNPMCTRCGGELKETSYIHKLDGSAGGTITARFDRDGIIHGNGDPWLPKLYGNSKVRAILLELRTATAEHKFLFNTYIKGHLSQIVFLNKQSQSKANEIAKAAKEQQEKPEFDYLTGEVSRAHTSTLWIGAPDGGDVKATMPDMEKMGSLETLEYLFVKITGAIYGVQPVMMNAPTRGPGGYFQKMQIHVNADTITEAQRMVEDPINNVLYPRMGIHDWEFKFEEVEPVNELQRVQILREKIETGQLAANAGLPVEFTDDEQLKVGEGNFKESEFPSAASAFLMPRPGEKRVQPGEDNKPPGQKLTPFNLTDKSAVKSMIVKDGDKTYLVQELKQPITPAEPTEDEDKCRDKEHEHA